MTLAELVNKELHFPKSADVAATHSRFEGSFRGEGYCEISYLGSRMSKEFKEKVLMAPELSAFHLADSTADRVYGVRRQPKKPKRPPPITGVENAAYQSVACAGPNDSRPSEAYRAKLSTLLFASITKKSKDTLSRRDGLP